MLTKDQLWRLRQEVVLGSLFTKDYQNSFGIKPAVVHDFFDAYLEDTESFLSYSVTNYNDNNFWALMSEYDNPENLYDFYEDWVYEYGMTPLDEYKY